MFKTSLPQKHNLHHQHLDIFEDTVNLFLQFLQLRKFLTAKISNIKVSSVINFSCVPVITKLCRLHDDVDSVCNLVLDIPFISAIHIITKLCSLYNDLHFFCNI